MSGNNPVVLNQESSRLQDGDGYQTPKSEGHRIPELSRPPTLKKRKKAFRYKKKLPEEHLLFENSRGGKQELEAFFRSFAANPNSLASNKKRRTISEDQ